MEDEQDDVADLRDRAREENGRRGLEFERQGFGVNVPGAWLRLYATLPGYCREFGWRASFLGAGCE